MPPNYTLGNQVITLLQKVQYPFVSHALFLISVVHIYQCCAKGLEDCEQGNDMMNH
jgi:hypothetical protein